MKKLTISDPSNACVCAFVSLCETFLWQEQHLNYQKLLSSSDVHLAAVGEASVLLKFCVAMSVVSR